MRYSLTAHQMLNADLTKDIKKPPEIEYQIPKKIFTKSEAASEQGDSLVMELCHFG